MTESWSSYTVMRTWYSKRWKLLPNISLLVLSCTRLKIPLARSVMANIGYIVVALLDLDGKKLLNGQSFTRRKNFVSPVSKWATCSLIAKHLGKLMTLSAKYFILWCRACCLSSKKKISTWKTPAEKSTSSWSVTVQEFEDFLRLLKLVCHLTLLFSVINLKLCFVWFCQNSLLVFRKLSQQLNFSGK